MQPYRSSALAASVAVAVGAGLLVASPVSAMTDRRTGTTVFDLTGPCAPAQLRTGKVDTAAIEGIDKSKLTKDGDGKEKTPLPSKEDIAAQKQQKSLRRAVVIHGVIGFVNCATDTWVYCLRPRVSRGKTEAIIRCKVDAPGTPVDGRSLPVMRVVDMASPRARVTTGTVVFNKDARIDYGPAVSTLLGAPGAWTSGAPLGTIRIAMRR